MSSIFESSPLPYGLMALWLALPGIWLGAGTLTQALTADRVVRRILQPAAAVAAWIVVVQLASMLARSFWVGLPTGMALLSATGLASWFWRRRTFVADTSTREGEPCFSRAMWLSMLLVTAPIAAMAFNGHFHDDLHPNGHLSFIAQLENDYFPLRFLGFPHILLRYHYGFDLVCTGLIALTRLRVDRAIQLVTIVDWAYCWCLLWVLGGRLTGIARGGLFTALATLLGGGSVVLLAPIALHRFAKADTLWRSLLGMYAVGDNLRLRVTVAENSFSHPFSLAFPLVTAALLVFFCSPKESSWVRGLLLGLLLASLSLVNYVAFITLMATIAFVEIVVARRWKFAFVVVAAAAVSAAAASLSAPVPGAPSLGLYPRFWFTEISGLPWPPWLARVLLWHVIVFVPLLPLALLGARHVASPMRWALLLLCGGCLAVPIFVGYAYTHDIMKFTFIALFAMGILAGVELTRLSADARPRGRALLGFAVVATTMTAVVLIGGILYGQFVHLPDLETYYEGPVTLAPADLQAMTWLRNRVGPDDIIYRKPSVALGYMQHGGLPMTALGNNTKQFAVPDDLAKRHDALLENPPTDLGSYSSFGIDWFVSSPDDPRMEQDILQWAQAGELVKKKEFGTLQIYKFVVPSNGSGSDRGS